MTTDGSTASARAALADLAGPGAAPLVTGLPVAPGSRQAAVLMLFGTLDEEPSRHRGRVPADLDVLLLARAATLRSHAGEIAFPGGRVDPGDADAVAAALREAREETGLDPAGVDVLGSLPPVPLEHSRHLVTPVLGWWRERSAVGVVDEAESAAVARVPVADLLDPARRGVTVLRRGGREWRGPAFAVDLGSSGSVWGEQTLWGFTAMLLDALFERLGWAEPWDVTRELPLPE